MYVDASDQSADCAPLAALLYDARSVPGIHELISAATSSGDFTVSHAPSEAGGWAEILRDGLTFDVRGLSDGKPQPLPVIEHWLGTSSELGENVVALQIFPGPHITGAQRLLPVLRVATALADCLAKIGQPRAICWIPAKNSVSPELFRRAVTPWFGGGPFPAIALVSMYRPSDGVIATEGLKFLIGQEFYLSGNTETSHDQMARVAVRLVDWLVAHGPISQSTQAVLAGSGAVLLEAQEPASIIARCS